MQGDRHTDLARWQPYRTIEDHIAGAVLTLIDVTERNRAIESMRGSEEQLRLLIETAKDYGIFTTDAQHRINIWNSGAENMFGYAEAEIIGHPLPPEDRRKGVSELEFRTASNNRRAQNEYWHSRNDGSLFYESGMMMPLRDRLGQFSDLAIILRDLAEQKRNEEVLQEHMRETMRFNAVAVGRETRMIDLKKEVNALCLRVGELARYSLEMENE